MNRRTVIAGLMALAAATAAGAEKAPLIGMLTLGIGPSSPSYAAFRKGLAEHGYIEGRNIALEYRFAEGHADRLPTMAAELLRLNPRIVVTESGPAAQAVSKAAKNIPIVMAIGANPVELGLAASLRRPGGNVTGLTLAGAERTAKQLQLLKETLPGATTVAVIYAPRTNIDLELQEARDTARFIGLEVQFFEVRSPRDFDATFEAVASARPSSLITVGHGMLFGARKRLVAFADKRKLPAVYPEREFVEDGGLMAYGPDIPYSFRRAATYVDKILKGAKPGDLPIEQPTKWGLAVNLRAAKSLGVKLPASVLVRADEIIQ
jgi:putative tryptophan/tyrosine transport system substrate-binding protein